MPGGGLATESARCATTRWGNAAEDRLSISWLHASAASTRGWALTASHPRSIACLQRRRRKGDAQREQDASRKAGLTPEQAAAYDAEREAQREAAKAAAAAQRAAVAEAMASGLRIAIDCSLSAGASEREVRSLCKQLQECAAANKRARRPVSLQFAGFAGAVRSFAVEGMHADRWPAAAGHEAALADLFQAQDLVVLSPDAEEVLEQLEADKVSKGLVE